MGTTRTTIAGIPIPDSAIAREATELVKDVAPPLLFHHSRRVFVWGSLQGEKLGLDYEPELFYVGAMFHDIGPLRATAQSTSASRSTAPTRPAPFSSAEGCPKTGS
jgi:hypothetical protein